MLLFMLLRYFLRFCFMVPFLYVVTILELVRRFLLLLEHGFLLSVDAILGLSLFSQCFHPLLFFLIGGTFCNSFRDLLMGHGASFFLLVCVVMLARPAMKT